MIASLPMYDRPETAAANDRLWAGVRDRMRAAGMDAPDALTRGAEDLWPQWTSPDLVLSQTCGYPYRARLHGMVTLVGTPDFGVEGLAPGYYCSVFVARADDPRPGLEAFEGARFAYNEAMSQSGWAAPQTHVATLGLSLPPTLRTGGHRFSALAVAEGRADIAAIDAVTWRMLRRWEPAVAGLREIARTAGTPGLPYIAAAGADGPRLFGILAEAIAAMPEADRDATGLRGLVAIPAAQYLAVPTPPAPDHFGH
jgi:ABC-type phosphate/phosphonate transport system substrate-binding protein